jgi:hypothetical protein
MTFGWLAILMMSGVERVGVDHHLHVVFVGDGEAIVDRGGRRAPVLVQLE